MFKSVLLTLALLVASAVVVPQPAQAGLIITQQFQFEDGTSFGVLSIDLDDIDEFGFVLDWQLFELFDMAIDDSFLLVALYDPLDLQAGFSFLSFDVSYFSSTLLFKGLWDSALAEGFYDIFSTDGEFVDAGIFVLGPAIITSVPEPVSWLLLTAGIGLLWRRRQHQHGFY